MLSSPLQKSKLSTKPLRRHLNALSARTILLHFVSGQRLRGMANKARGRFTAVGTAKNANRLDAAVDKALLPTVSCW